MLSQQKPNKKSNVILTAPGPPGLLSSLRTELKCMSWLSVFFFLSSICSECQLSCVFWGGLWSALSSLSQGSYWRGVERITAPRESRPMSQGRGPHQGTRFPKKGPEPPVSVTWKKLPKSLPCDSRLCLQDPPDRLPNSLSQRFLGPWTRSIPCCKVVHPLLWRMTNKLGFNSFFFPSEGLKLHRGVKQWPSLCSSERNNCRQEDCYFCSGRWPLEVIVMKSKRSCRNPAPQQAARKQHMWLWGREGTGSGLSSALGLWRPRTSEELGDVDWKFTL